MSDSLQDPAGYLQRRVATFAGAAYVLFTVMLLADFATPAEGEAMLSSTRASSLAVILTNAVVWQLTRRGQRSERFSRILELSATAVMMLSLATLPLHPPIPGAGGVMGLFTPITLGLVVLLRAAVIPSPAWLSVLVALVWGTVMTVSAYVGFENLETVLTTQSEYDQRLLPVAVNGFASVGFAFVAGVVSHIVHGLQRKVREAMQLGQYTLEAKIGEGGMGAVYRAKHAMLLRPTAVKLLPPDKSSEEAITRFEREVQQTSRLTHPNTVAIFDFGRTQDGIFYYAMEYLEGLSLRELVELEGPLPPGRVIHLVRQAARALSEAHAMGLVHRDIKPDNIVLCERGGDVDVVKVLDFGLVKDVDAPADANLSASGSLQGTPRYMAPEAVLDPETLDARADLYALGCVAWFLLAGEPVFPGGVVEVVSHHLRTEPDPPSERLGAPIDPTLEGIVLRLLEKAPDARFATAVDLLDALEGCADAHAWTDADARAWWDAHRKSIAERHARRAEPASRSFAPA